MDNPFTILYRGLWQWVDLNPQLSGMVAPKNRIRYDDEKTRDPLKRTASTADLPELVLQPVSFTPKALSNSSHSTYTRVLRWIVNTGDRRITAGTHDIEWFLFLSSIKFRPDILNLEFNGGKFIHDFRIGEGTQADGDVFNRNSIAGWVSIMEISVEMHFRTATLKYLI